MICSSTLSHLVLVQDIKPDGSLEKNPEEEKKRLCTPMKMLPAPHCKQEEAFDCLDNVHVVLYVTQFANCCSKLFCN